MVKSASHPPLRYGSMRLRWCGWALRAFIARWGVYGVVTGLALSAGASGWEQVLQAVAAVLVLPLFSASQHGWLLWPAALGQALMGAVAVWGGRSLLWPTHWAESERALPLSHRETVRSDLLVVLLVLTPLLLLYVAGAVSVLAHKPAWLLPTQGRALAALTLAAVMSVGLGVALLQPQRRYRSGGVSSFAEQNDLATTGKRSSAVGPRRALILLPLWRGPALRTGVTLVVSTTALIGIAVIPAALGWTARWPWLLAGWAVIALLAATRINHLSRLELTELLQACAGLPIDRRMLWGTRAALGLWPLLPGLIAVLTGVAVARPAGLRPAVLWAWVAACVLACLVEVSAEPQRASDKAARWWFSLLVCICLACEVVA